MPTEDYRRDFQGLFTLGGPERELRDLGESDPRDSFHYFTREVGAEEPSTLPWYKRHPRTAWRVFLAMAFRLGPARHGVRGRWLVRSFSGLFLASRASFAYSIEAGAQGASKFRAARFVCLDRAL